jgi:hypothetical protein
MTMRLPIYAALAALAACSGLPAADEPHAHHHHAAMPAGAAAATSAPAIDAAEFKVVKLVKAPDNFMGGLAYDRGGGRLWLLSVGPPANTRTSSILYRIDPETGKVMAQAKMPFLGEFGAPVYLDGNLYVGIPHASRLYKVSVDDASFGRIVREVRLPTLNDLDERISEPFRFPFINFPGLAVTPDKRLLLHAEDLGLLLTIDPESGRMLNKVRTMKGLSGATTAMGPGKELLLLGNADPEMTLLKRDMRIFMFRSAHGFTPPYAVRTEQSCGRNEARDITWALLEAETGEILASTLDRCSRTRAGAVALVRQEMASGFPYGKLTFLTLGEEGILTVEWKPK